VSALLQTATAAAAKKGIATVQIGAVAAERWLGLAMVLLQLLKMVLLLLKMVLLLLLKMADYGAAEPAKDRLAMVLLQLLK
jgi:hypothetical protein